jgi:4-hydroxy-2-oxoheptanedioate aldolase
MKQLADRLRAGETALGCWLVMGSPTGAEIVGRAGFDWVLIDMEHGLNTEERLPAIMQALEGTTAAAIVRVESQAHPRAQRVLDMGAEGVMFPQIRSAAGAREAIASMRYPPAGTRGVARSVRATGFGIDVDRYLAATRTQLAGIVQIENLEALEEVEAIAAIDGVDVLFIGPADLTMALGNFLAFDDPRYQAAIRRTAAAAKAAGKTAGVLMSKIEDAPMYRELGFRFLALGSDGGFVSAGAGGALEAMRREFKS